jgi:hypothetical protein
VILETGNLSLVTSFVDALEGLDKNVANALPTFSKVCWNDCRVSMKVKCDFVDIGTAELEANGSCDPIGVRNNLVTMMAQVVGWIGICKVAVEAHIIFVIW